MILDGPTVVPVGICISTRCLRNLKENTKNIFFQYQGLWHYSYLSCNYIEKINASYQCDDKIRQIMLLGIIWSDSGT